MVEQVAVFLDGSAKGIENAVLRYALLERISSSCALRGVVLLAFGIGRDEIRLVLEGHSGDITNVVRGVKVGTARAALKFGHRISWAETPRSTVEPSSLSQAVAWAHLAPDAAQVDGPLCSPWSSHRDLLRYRAADFYDASVLEGRVDVAEVHAMAGGGVLPTGWPPASPRSETLNELLRVAASVVGVLPADRSCFALFVSLAKERGWETRHIADALMLSRRRVRQLTVQPSPRLPLALHVLADERLRMVP